MVEAEISNYTPTPLLILFAISTAILVFVHLLSLLIATFLLPDLDALAAIPKTELAHNSAYISRTPCVNISWFLSHILGIFLFFVELSLIGYVKFYSPNLIGTQANTTVSQPVPEYQRIHAGTAAVVTIFVLGLISAPFIIYSFHNFYRKRMQLQSQQLYKAEELLRKLDALESPVHQETTRTIASGGDRTAVNMREKREQILMKTTDNHEVRDRVAVVAHSYYISDEKRISSIRNSLENFQDAQEGDEFV